MIDLKITALYCVFMFFSTAVIVESDSAKVKKRRMDHSDQQIEMIRKEQYLMKELRAMEDSIKQIKCKRNVLTSKS